MLPAILTGLISLGSSLVSGVSDNVSQYQERKKEETDAKHRLKIAKIDAKRHDVNVRHDMRVKTLNADLMLDMESIKSNRESIVDEVLVYGTMALVAMHFIPYTQPHMLNGWLAMGYKGTPWWFEFAVVGIFVRKLGLMSFFRMWMTRFGAKKADQQNLVTTEQAIELTKKNNEIYNIKPIFRKDK